MKLKRHLLLELITVVCTMAFVLGCNQKKTESSPITQEEPTAKLDMQVRNGKIIKGYKVGDQATDFTLKNVDGVMVSMANYTDAKGFIVIFTCNTCPFAVASEERIVALDKKYKALGYPVIAVNPNDPAVQPDDTFALMQTKAKSAGFTFPYLYDANDKVYATYGATKTPHTYLLQRVEGKLVVKYIGAIDDSVRKPNAVEKTYLANAIDALLAGQEIEVTETKAIGCSIKV